jgi:hypothetical protein
LQSFLRAGFRTSFLTLTPSNNMDEDPNQPDGERRLRVTMIRWLKSHRGTAARARGTAFEFEIIRHPNGKVGDLSAL